MSKIYTKEITITGTKISFIQCDKCKIETAFCFAIDVWAMIDNENYCLDCQEKYKVNYYEPKK